MTVCVCVRAHAHACLEMCLFKLLKQLTNLHEILYADYAAEGHHSATPVNILQSVITCQMNKLVRWK
jgi:hypothetical protein